MLTDKKMSGMGTLMIDGQEVVITAVTGFTANPKCRTTGESCATITFDATVDNESGHTGIAEAFNINSESCSLVFVPGVEEGQGPHFIYQCGD
jgi:hypothetical protein